MSITITDDLFALASFLLDSYDIFEVFAAVGILEVFAAISVVRNSRPPREVRHGAAFRLKKQSANLISTRRSAFGKTKPTLQGAPCDWCRQGKPVGAYDDR